MRKGRISYTSVLSFLGMFGIAYASLPHSWLEGRAAALLFEVDTLILSLLRNSGMPFCEETHRLFTGEFTDLAVLLLWPALTIDDQMHNNLQNASLVPPCFVSWATKQELMQSSFRNREQFFHKGHASICQKILENSEQCIFACLHKRAAFGTMFYVLSNSYKHSGVGFSLSEEAQIQQQALSCGL